MKKGLKYILILLAILIIGFLAYLGITKYLEYREEMRIKNAIIKVELIDPLEVEFNTDIKLSDLITSINGDLIDDFKINTKVVGKREIKFKYINEENIKVPYSFYVNVVDSVTPVIWLNDTYTVNVGYSKRLEYVIMCGDNYDNNPECEIVGEDGINKVGT